jgi:hypothetical protein
MEKKKIYRLIFLIFLILICSKPVAQDSDDTLVPGSEVRREICEQFSTIHLDAYRQLTEGVSVEQYLKIIEIGVAGKENVDAIVELAYASAILAESYINAGKSESDFEIDFLHPCITTDNDLGTIMRELIISKLPEDHPTRKQILGIENNDIEFESDGTLKPKSYANILGAEFEGTHGVRAVINRLEGIITLCGYEFSASHYDYIYSSGKPVKISGSMNLATHPKHHLYSILKIKGEDMILSKLIDGNPKVEFVTFNIEDLYPTIDSTPIIEHKENIQCEDGYVCQANLGWDKVMEAMIANIAGVAYRREGGKTDVEVKLNWLEPENSNTELMKFTQCISELIENTKTKIENSE